jgi:hypothetical protein
MPREILLPKVKQAVHRDLNENPVVFEYKGRLGEINDFVRLAKDAGLKAEMQEEQEINGMSQLKMTVPGKQFDIFTAVLHEWKTDI